MKKTIWLILFLAMGLVLPCRVNAQSALEDARKDIATQHYDVAVTNLERYVAENTNSADGELLLAQAYHWKKDLANAKLHYEKAAALNPDYKLQIVPLLDELGDSAEIIRVVAPEVARGGALRPALLGSLATAYKRSNRSQDAERIRNLLATTHYANQSDEDYKNYVLAYCALWDDDRRQAKDLLKKIKDKSFLTYARTTDKFKKLFDDEEFLKLTK